MNNKISVHRDKMNSHELHYKKSVTKINKRVTVHVSRLLRGCQTIKHLKGHYCKEIWKIFGRWLHQVLDMLNLKYFFNVEKGIQVLNNY